MAAPDQDGRWITPCGIPAILEELELCGVPADATRLEARRLLELCGVYVSEASATLGHALRTWRTQAGTRVPAEDPAGDLPLAA